MAEGRSFWTTLPGILTGIAAVLGAAGGLLVTFHQIGWIGVGDRTKVTQGTSQAEVDPNSQTQNKSELSLDGIALQFTKALITGDRTTFDQLTSSDFCFDGKTSTKQEVLERVQSNLGEGEGRALAERLTIGETYTVDELSRSHPGMANCQGKQPVQDDDFVIFVSTTDRSAKCCGYVWVSKDSRLVIGLTG